MCWHSNISVANAKTNVCFPNKIRTKWSSVLTLHAVKVSFISIFVGIMIHNKTFHLFEITYLLQSLFTFVSR